MGVKEKVLGIEPRKILTPVPGLKDAYSLSYAIFRETQYDYDFTIYCEMKKFFPLLKHFFYTLNLLGVKEKVLGMEPRKILTPVSGL